ncbi:hypothetical protein C8R44DRAFT_820966 [Mycena epipterygia]|nr:hypothetical protein C8R44DRAFT_820966 [Mycena epipterygia]
MGLLGGGESGGVGGVETGLPILPTLSLPTLPTLSLPGISLPTSLPTSIPLSATSASIPSSSSLPLSTSLALPSSTSASSAFASSAPSFTTTVPSASAPPPTSLADVSTDPNGGVHTVSHTVIVGASGSPTAAAAVHKTTFCNFGLIALVLLVVIATFFVRRSKRRRLLDDAVSFDPGLLPAADRYDVSEKGHSSKGSLGTIGSRPGGYGTYAAQPHPEYYGGAQQNAHQPEYYGDAPQNAYQPEYYGGAPQNAHQSYYSTYVPPMADAPPPSSLAGTSSGLSSRVPQHSIARVPVPQVPLPAEFGSSGQDSPQSAEEAEFWARTLHVVSVRPRCSTDSAIECGLSTVQYDAEFGKRDRANRTGPLSFCGAN